jgi:hypothetical protein
MGMLMAGVVLAAVVLFALAGTNLFAGGRDDGPGAGDVPQTTASQPAPSAAPVETQQPTPKAKPAKGKGKGNDKKD